MTLLLAPLSFLWWLVAVLRGKLFDWGLLPSRCFDIPVICVGNLAVGGTGKTPHVEYLLRLLHAHGYKVAMLSRGYGRKSKGYVLAGSGHTASEIGDEPYQMLHNCPFATVAVCERRVEGISSLLGLPHPPDVIVLDDAYQHRYVRAGYNILLTDAHCLYTHDHLLPWGRLREPAGAARRAQAVIVTKCGPGERPPLPVSNGQRLFYSHIIYGVPYGLQSGMPEPSFSGRQVLVIAGIANPAPLAAHLRSSGAAGVRLREFRDHHVFTAADAQCINRDFRALPAGAVACTTQKDAPRLQAIWEFLYKGLKERLYVLPIEVEVNTDRAKQISFNQTILSYVNSHQRNSCMD